MELEKEILAKHFESEEFVDDVGAFPIGPGGDGREHFPQTFLRVL